MLVPKLLYRLFIFTLLCVAPYCNSQIRVTEGTFISGELHVVQKHESTNLESVTVYLAEKTSLSGKNSFSSNVKFKIKEKPFKKPSDKRENQIAKTSKKVDVSLPKTLAKNYFAFNQNKPNEGLSKNSTEEVATVLSFYKHPLRHEKDEGHLVNVEPNSISVRQIVIFYSQISIDDSIPRAPPFLKHSI